MPSAAARWPGAPEFGEHEAIIAIDHAHIGVEEFLLGDMALIDVGDLEAIEILEGAGGLGGPQIAAVAEGRRDIALRGRGQPGLKARQRAEGGGPVQPVFGVGQDIDDTAFGMRSLSSRSTSAKPSAQAGASADGARVPLGDRQGRVGGKGGVCGADGS